MDRLIASAPPLITTVIPTFRRPRLLRRAVLSALEQEGVPLRVCVYDNASGDDTAAVVNALAADDPRLGYFCHEQNLGAASNFEFGLRQVETPFFSILSDDDYLFPGFYKRAVAELIRNPGAMFFAGVTFLVDEQGNICDARLMRWPREGLFTPPEGLMRLMHRMAPIWTGVVFRRDVLDRIGVPDKQVQGPSDLDYMIRITAQFPYLMEKIPAAAYTLNSSSFSAIEPLASFWPGWKRMFDNLEALDVLDSAAKAVALAALRADGRQMLFRRGANTLAQARYEFVRDAATALDIDCGQIGKATILRSLAYLCERSVLAQRIYTRAYKFAERHMVRDRARLQVRYGDHIRPVS
jgi:glycosyltransferase involved in cell wall biosynthesis